MIESNDDKINHKYILFYNDSIHNIMLIDLVKKYVEEFENSQKKYVIYIVTNSKIDKLRKYENVECSKFRLF